VKRLVFLFMDRKGFNFYKSYYDVALELPEQDRNEFLWAIVSAEFTGEMIEPKSKLARLMFIGQKHSVLKQLEGFKAATKAPHEGTHKGGTEAPRQQVQVQVQEKGQVQEKVKDEGGSQIIIYGDHSEKYFTINPSTIGATKYRVNSTGFKEFSDTALMGTWFKKEFLVDMFWDQWNGKMFNDVRHLNNVMLNINNPKKNG